uniref:Uncharacterized protein n=1 Tax=Oryza alta TaxID=52545 RepID=A0A1V1H109_9ORYZ|nr:hypothetical protein [Oryza alta]BAX25058.1 hypothetical protein [Oryza alta]
MAAVMGRCESDSESPRIYWQGATHADASNEYTSLLRPEEEMELADKEFFLEQTYFEQY